MRGQMRDVVRTCGLGVTAVSRTILNPVRRLDASRIASTLYAHDTRRACMCTACIRSTLAITHQLALPPVDAPPDGVLLLVSARAVRIGLPTPVCRGRVRRGRHRGEPQERGAAAAAGGLPRPDARSLHALLVGSHAEGLQQRAHHLFLVESSAVVLVPILIPGGGEERRGSRGRRGGGGRGGGGGGAQQRRQQQQPRQARGQRVLTTRSYRS